jgi:hypothetical protein
MKGTDTGLRDGVEPRTNSSSAFLHDQDPQLTNELTTGAPFQRSLCNRFAS